MMRNIGTIDKVIRILLGLIIGALGYYYTSWWGLIALIPILTAFTNFCPAYTLFKFKTSKD